jgi:hypothetical protein
MLIEFAASSLLAAGVAMLLLQGGALWVAAWFGRRHARRIAGSEEAAAEGVGVVVGALLGLLGFALAVTIGIAENRFDDRRRAALDEANAISTAWLRADAMAHPEAKEIARLLRDYTAIRLEWAEAGHDSAAIARANAETSAMQRRVWHAARAVMQDRPDPITALLVAALNEAFDLATTQRWAYRGQMPSELPWLLFALTIVSVGAIGYQWGLRRLWHPWLALLLFGAWSACLVLIVDLASPRVGLVRVDVAPYRWTLEGMRPAEAERPAP